MTLQARERPTGIRRYLPGVASIADGARHSPVADGRAALTVWAVVVPQSLAYATLAGVPSVHGLYAAVGALALYALVGTCRDLNMGAESTVALMAAAAVALTSGIQLSVRFWHPSGIEEGNAAIDDAVRTIVTTLRRERVLFAPPVDVAIVGAAGPISSSNAAGSEVSS